MRWQKYIIHADLNHCYAQIEEMLNPSLRHIPMAVGGNEEKRHGIILAKNDIAKKYGIKTAETLREAFRKCPNLYIVHPHYDKYIYYTNEVKKIYSRYTDKVESFGLDEAWIDITDSIRLFGNPIKLAKHIQDEVYNELGLTVSMGISFNKIFAKLGSDLDKNKGFTIISPDNFKDKLFNLKVSELLYVGKATTTKLNARGIFTIGDLANRDIKYLKNILGKSGEMLYYFANGLEMGEVKEEYYKRDIKSISNGVTAIRDLRNIDDIKMIIWRLAESIASRLKDESLVGDVISIALRDKNLNYFTRQKKIVKATNLTKEIFNVAMYLVKENVIVDSEGFFNIFYRSITLAISHLSKEKDYIEYDLFEDETKREKEYKLDKAIDEIRNKYGFHKIERLVNKIDEKLSDFDPKGDHIIHPESWF